MAAKRIESAVDWFSRRMKRTLLLPKNLKKGGWDTCYFSFLLRRLKEEVAEVEEVLSILPPSNPDRVIRECTDVANIAMMIADKINQNEEGNSD
jgi:hypothetical protein